MTLFNLDAAPLSFDPIKDRNKNAHMAIFGRTGSGKSAFLINELVQTINQRSDARKLAYSNRSAQLRTLDQH